MSLSRLVSEIVEELDFSITDVPTEKLPLLRNQYIESANRLFHLDEKLRVDRETIRVAERRFRTRINEIEEELVRRKKAQPRIRKAKEDGNGVGQAQENEARIAGAEEREETSTDATR